MTSCAGCGNTTKPLRRCCVQNPNIDDSPARDGTNEDRPLDEEVGEEKQIDDQSTDDKPIDGEPSNGKTTENQTTSATYYCSNKCQEQHWKQQHKKVCTGLQHRKQLKRAGDLLQRIFYDIRREAFALPIAEVPEKEHGGLWLKSQNITVDHSGHYLVEFPSSFFEDEEDEKAVLARDACGDAVSRMLFLVVAALKGSYSDIQHVELAGPGRHLRLIFPSESESDIPNHELFEVTLKGGEAYAFDLAAAQYGCYRTVTPWVDYVQRLDGTDEVEHVFGKDASEFEQNGADLLEKYHNVRKSNPTEWLMMDGGDTVDIMFELVARLVAVEIKEWQEKQLSLTELLVLPAKEYRPLRDELTSTIREAIRAFVTWIKEQNGMLYLLRVPQSMYCETTQLTELNEQAAQMLLRVAPVSRWRLPAAGDEGA